VAEPGAVQLPHADTLTLIAEVSAAFVGFSYVIGLLQEDRPDAAATRTAMRGVAELALISGAGSFLALASAAYDVSADAVWRFGSFAIGVVWSVAHYFAARRFRAAGRPMMSSRLTIAPVTLAAFGIVLCWWNVAIPDEASGARYVSALCLALGGSALFFLGTTFGRSE
jgi:hypothetical protein